MKSKKLIGFLVVCLSPLASAQGTNNKSNQPLREIERRQADLETRQWEMESRQRTEDAKREKQRKADQLDESVKDLLASSARRRAESSSLLAEAVARRARAQEEQERFDREKEMWRREDEEYAARKDALARHAIEREKLRLKQQQAESRLVPSESQRPDIFDAFTEEQIQAFRPSSKNKPKVPQGDTASDRPGVDAAFEINPDVKPEGFDPSTAVLVEDVTPVKIAEWRKSAAQGQGEAQYELGLCYYNGEGVPMDYVAAYMWFNLSAASGHQTAATFRGKLAKSMTPEQIAEAQKMCREWKPKKQDAEFVPVQKVADPKYVTDPAILKQLNAP